MRTWASFTRILSLPLHAALTYSMTSHNWCGSRTVEGSRSSAIMGGIVSGALFGGIVGAGAGAGPMGQIVTGTILTGIGFGGFVGSGYEFVNDIIQGDGFNTCAFTDGVMSTMAIFFGINMVNNGIAQAVAKGLTRPLTQGTAPYEASVPIAQPRPLNLRPHSITNMRDGVSGNQMSINAIQPGEGAGWTGAYDATTGRFVAIPSDPMATNLRSTGLPPEGIVPRQGGHATAATLLVDNLGITMAEFADPNTNVSAQFIGFNLSYISESQLILGWKSNALNIRSNYGNGRYASIEGQALVIEAIQAALPEGVTLINPGTP